MLTQSKKDELLNAIKYNPSSSPRPYMLKIRSNPYLHSILNKLRIWYSRNVLSKSLKDRYSNNKSKFILNNVESRYVNELRSNGIVVLEDYFDASFIDSLEKKVNCIFRDLKIDEHGGYNVAHGRLKTLKGMTYEELAISEESIGMLNPLLNVPEFVKIAFNESFLKIVSTYFGFIPSHQVSSSRAFPHLPPMESSYFHKDSGNHEVLHIFVYLVDVDDNGGPFCYIPKTHKNDVKSCSPMTNYDLGIKKDYGRISDKEINKFYHESEWMRIKGKRGSVVITHVNGLHKGPMWMGDNIEKLKARDIFHINFRSSVGVKKENKSEKIYKKDIKNFSELQSLFLDNYEIIES